MPIMESVKLNLRPRLRLTPTFSMEDIMDTTWDMLATMDMLDIPMLTGDKLNLPYKDDHEIISASLSLATTFQCLSL